MGVTTGIQEHIVDHIVKDGPINLTGSPVVRALAKLLKLELGGSEISFYGPHLVRGEHLVEPLPCQGRLWEYMDSVNAPGSRFGWDQEFAMAELRGCIRAAESRQDTELSAKLSRICRAEELLGAASMLFNFLLTRDRQPLARASERLSTRFGAGLNWLNLTDLQGAFSPTAWSDQLSGTSSTRDGLPVARCRELS